MKIFFLSFVSLIVFCQIIFGQSKQKGFAVYQLPDSPKSEQLSNSDLKKLKPTGTPLIAESDIWFYQKETHAFRIEYTASQRLKKITDEDETVPFAVFVGDEAIYVGSFWKSILSFSFSGIVIDTYKPLLVADKSSSPDFPVLTFDLGYPSPAFFKGTDLRADARIFKALEKAGKLYEKAELLVKCKKITATGTRRPASKFTFEVLSVRKGNFKGKEITFTLNDGELLPELGAKQGWGLGTNVAFNPDTEIVLEISQQVGKVKPEFFIREYWKK